jgi:hypothetical protein
MADTEHCVKWIAAPVCTEIVILEANYSWVKVPKLSVSGQNIPGTWVFHHKHTPDGNIKKYKARFC